MLGYVRESLNQTGQKLFHFILKNVNAIGKKKGVCNYDLTFYRTVTGAV